MLNIQHALIESEKELDETVELRAHTGNSNRSFGFNFIFWLIYKVRGELNFKGFPLDLFIEKFPLLVLSLGSSCVEVNKIFRFQYLTI